MAADEYESRSRRAVALASSLSLSLAAAACSGALDGPGRSRSADDGWDEPRPADVAPAPTGRPLPGFAELSTWPERARVTTGHPGAARRASLRAGPEADGYGRRGRPPFAPGATLLATLEGSDGGRVEAHYLMRKREPGYFPEGGDWEYAVVSPEGRVLAEGRLELCARCHAEATREHLFEPLELP